MMRGGRRVPERHGHSRNSTYVASIRNSSLSVTRAFLAGRKTTRGPDGFERFAWISWPEYVPPATSTISPGFAVL